MKEYDEKKIQSQKRVRVDPDVSKLGALMVFEDISDQTVHSFEKCERFVMSESVAKLLELEYTKAKYAR